jgi:signal peptidase II
MVNISFIIALIIIVLDRITKLIFLESSNLNKGAAFGILQGWQWLFILAAVIVVVVILKERNNKKYQIGMGLLLGGTVSNLIDRLYYQGVIDFISIFSIPNFNIADLSNVVGVMLIIYIMHKN